MLKIIYQSEVVCPVSRVEVETIVKLSARREKKIQGLIEITVVGDAAIRKLNKQFRGKDVVTDVLSFAWREDSVMPTPELGQIYISYPQIVRQARDIKISPREEFVRMLTHGLLHLVGHDHVVQREAEEMFGLQEKIVVSAIKRI